MMFIMICTADAQIKSTLLTKRKISKILHQFKDMVAEYDISLMTFRRRMTP